MKFQIKKNNIYYTNYVFYIGDKIQILINKYYITFKLWIFKFEKLFFTYIRIFYIHKVQ